MSASCLLVLSMIYKEIYIKVHALKRDMRNKKTVEPWGPVLMKDYNCSCSLCSCQSMAVYYTITTPSSQIRIKDWSYSFLTQIF